MSYLDLRIPSLCAATLVLVAAAYGDDADSRFTVSVTATIESHFGAYRAHVDLGRLPASSKGAVEIELVNPYEFPIPIDAVTKGCNCMDLEYSDTEIPASGSTTLTMLLETLASSRGPEVFGGLSFPGAAGAADELRVIVRYQLAGMMGFSDELAVVNVSPTAPVTEFTVPIVLTEPLSWRAVRVRASAELKAVRLTPTEIDGVPAIRCFIRGSDVPATGLTGTITIDSPQSSRRDTLTCVIRREAEFTVGPRVIRFFPITDSEGVEATAFVRLTAAPDAAGAAGRKPQAPIIDCSFRGASVVADTEPLADGVTRVRLRLSPSAVERILSESQTGGDTAELFWHARSAQRTHHLSTRLLLPDAPKPATVE